MKIEQVYVCIGFFQNGSLKTISCGCILTIGGFMGSHDILRYEECNHLCYGLGTAKTVDIIDNASYPYDSELAVVVFPEWR